VAISPTSAAAAQLPSQLADVPAVAGLPPVPASVAPASPGPVPPPDANRVVLRATADAWILVKDHSGAVLLNRVLKTGETWPVPPRPDLVLTTGNAGGTDILVDGATTASLGGPGTVRRDMLLDPDQIKDGKLAGAAVPQLASSRPRQ
jgi:cytoskeleton protein RodZ